jgi:hypothetical protein
MHSSGEQPLKGKTQTADAQDRKQNNKPKMFVQLSSTHT